MPNRLAEPKPRACWNGEPTVREMLDDPIVHLVMARDRLRPDDVSRLMASVRGRLSAAD